MILARPSIPFRRSVFPVTIKIFSTLVKSRSTSHQLLENRRKDVAVHAIIDQDFRTVLSPYTQGRFCGTILFLITSCSRLIVDLNRNDVICGFQRTTSNLLKDQVYVEVVLSCRYRMIRHLPSCLHRQLRH